MVCPFTLPVKLFIWMLGPAGLGAIYDSQVYAVVLPTTWRDRNVAQIEMIDMLVDLT